MVIADRETALEASELADALCLIVGSKKRAFHY